jgi:predicted TIM-barrel fold metal-dependent hydrolase
MAVLIPPGGLSARTRLDGLLVVDLDVHLLEDKAALVSYLDPKWRPAAVEQPVPPFGGGGRLFPNFPGQWQPRWHVALTPDEMRRDLDELSIDLGVLFPESFLGLARQPNPQFALEAARAYNRWLVETYLPVRGFYGGVIVAPQDPLGSAGEIERYASHAKVVGVVMPTSGVDPLWGDRRYDPIYDAARAHGLALLFHAGGVLQMPMLPWDLRQLDTWFLQHTYSHSIAIESTVASLFSTAMPARYPELRMIFIEAGISWAAHTMLRLDYAWERRRLDVPELVEPPSAYMRRQMWYATQPIEEPENLHDMAELFGLVGEDAVVFASDYPHHDFDHPKKVHDIPISPAAKAGVMGLNALRALALPAPTAAERVPPRVGGRP